MKKIIEFIKKDFKGSRGSLLLKIAFFLFMVMTVTISIIEKEYILIVWQLYYTIAMFLIFSLQDGILCLGCLKVSYHPEDIKNLYCAECKKFHKKSDEQR